MLVRGASNNSASSASSTAAGTAGSRDAKVASRGSSKRRGDKRASGANSVPITAAAGVAAGSSGDDASGDGMVADKVLAGESKYPAVTALETHLFKRDYAGEAVGDRLNRLETKVFGHPSKFTDLSERVDALKEKTNVDVAKAPANGTDWTSDEDEDGSGHSFPVPKRTEPVARADGDDGRSFSGRDVAGDLRKAFGIGVPGNTMGGQASGAYGMGGASAGRGRSNSASGAYGMGGGSSSGRSASSVSNLAMATPDRRSRR